VVSPRRESTYKNICSDSDPPRSISICPQRACVGFGCQEGIELHWVDALTGQDLRRWFPLSAPSDFLYFLPQRMGMDSERKLKLISSAVHPEEPSPLGRRFGYKTGSFGPWRAWEFSLLGAAQNDHYMAVPVGDGIHVIFTDPIDGFVYVGGDAPVSKHLNLPSASLRYSSSGLRSVSKDCWVSIEDNLYNENSTTIADQTLQHSVDTKFPPRPRVYAAGKDLRYGIRVAVGYQDWLVFYTIPTEIVNQGTNEEKLMHTATFRELAPRAEPARPIEIIGCHVAYIPALVDLAVDSGPSMTVWAFGSAGEAKAFRLEGT
ncbi:hypothetical protein BDZ91DRAFT_635142, partial [Kalaharituber pfeilii]